MSITTTTDRIEVIQDGPVSDGPLPDGSQSTDGTTDRAERPGPDGAEVQASNRPTFTITDAAAACSVSRKTITRKLAELAIHGAAKDDDGVWRIPVEALLAVGLHPGRSLPAAGPATVRPVAPAPVVARPVELDTITIPRDRWDDVRIRLARAEAEAAERGLALADARLALRALTAGPATRQRTGDVLSDPNLTAQTDTRAATPAQAVSGSTGAEAAEVGHSHSTGQGPIPPEVTKSENGSTPAPGQPGVGDPANALPGDVVAARNLAARTGGYVPAGPTAIKKRRWWQSR